MWIDEIPVKNKKQIEDRLEEIKRLAYKKHKRTFSDTSIIIASLDMTIELYQKLLKKELEE